MHSSISGKIAIATVFMMSAANVLANPASQQGIGNFSVSARGYAEPVSSTEEQGEERFDDSLAAAIVQAYASNPVLAASRYDLRATDDELGHALAQARMTLDLQVSGEYDLTIPGRMTQASRPVTDRLNDPNIERNALATSLVAEQPLYTGGRITSAVASARAGIEAGRETLRGAEGDMLVNLIAAYSDVRLDARAVAIRQTNVGALEAMLDEVAARRDAGELTRTDIAQAETQLQAARVQLDAALAQFESSRASFAVIVGREPGSLAPTPALPGLPQTIDDAFEAASASNPDLRQAIAQQRLSQTRIAAARSEGRPTLSLQGIAGTNGQAVPFDRRDQDVTFTGRATLTIPLVAGGRVRSLVAQAENRESADRLRIEATRRQMVQSIVNAWNRWVTADRNLATQNVQLKAARIYYEGTFEEYREGLRSTFDVLYAQNSLRETEIALLTSQRDSYVAQVYLLRQLGRLEVEQLLEGPATYDPTLYTRKAEGRSGVPWGGIVRAVDRIGAPDGKPQGVTMPDAISPVATLAPPTMTQGRPLASDGPWGTSGPLMESKSDE